MRSILFLCLFIFSALAAQEVSFSSHSLSAEEIRVPSADKKPVLLVFWASWCESCNKEAPMIIKLKKELNQRIHVIGVNVDEDTTAAASFVKKYGLTYSSIADSELKVSEKLGIDSTPSLVLIDGSGSVLIKTKALNTKMIKAIRTLLSSEKVSRPTQKKKNKPLTQVLARSPEHVVEDHAAIMGTDIHILIHTQDKTQAQVAIAAAMAEMRRIDDDMTDWRPIGQVWKINHNSGKQAVQVTPELLQLLQQSVDISKMTGGLFDISYRSVGPLWDFYGADPTIPSSLAIAEGLKLVGYQHIVINTQDSTVYLPIAGMKIGLGGIAKGYAVDRAVAIIDNYGFKDFVVNAGGDLYVRGSKKAQLWRVGIRHPRKDGELIAEIPAKNYAIVTSGDYERFFVRDGKRYCHIINPQTGYPADGCQSVTVLAKKSAQADALATGIFLMGARKGLAFAESLESVEALIIDSTGAIHMTKNFSR